MQEDRKQNIVSSTTSLFDRVIQKLFAERVVLTILCGLGAAFSLWLQFVVLEDEPVVEEQDDNSPDYYIDNFVAVGMDEQGNRRYQLEAERLVHHPKEDIALVDKPHVIQFEPGSAPRHTYADDGLVGPDFNEVLLTGNVRVIQGYNGAEGASAGGVQTSKRMKIRLKDKIDR